MRQNLPIIAIREVIPDLPKLYSRKVQRNANRQPMVISLAEKERLEAGLKSSYGGLVTKAEKRMNRMHLKVLRLGKEYRGVWFFNPLGYESGELTVDMDWKHTWIARDAAHYERYGYFENPPHPCYTYFMDVEGICVPACSRHDKTPLTLRKRRIVLGAPNADVVCLECGGRGEGLSRRTLSMCRACCVRYNASITRKKCLAANVESV